eukprot:1186013-Prorocentrum_minimum.AAC.3
MFHLPRGGQGGWCTTRERGSGRVVGSGGRPASDRGYGTSSRRDALLSGWPLSDALVSNIDVRYGQLSRSQSDRHRPRLRGPIRFLHGTAA